MHAWPSKSSRCGCLNPQVPGLSRGLAEEKKRSDHRSLDVFSRRSLPLRICYFIRIAACAGFRLQGSWMCSYLCRMTHFSISMAIKTTLLMLRLRINSLIGKA